MAPEKLNGKVIAHRLNLRASPNGPVLGVLERGADLEIMGHTGTWLQVWAGGVSGFVSARYVRIEPAREGGDSPSHEEDLAALRVVGNEALDPGGRRFARKYKAGFFSYGSTTIDAFVRDNPRRFASASDSTARVMRAVSENEGKYEAINTWDNAFLSFGIFQWTSGVGSEAGELPALIERLSHDHRDTFEACFGRYGLSTAAVTTIPGLAPVGYFSLNGVPLETAEAKNALRSLRWAYIFWRAGHDDDVRETQTIHAMERIGLFCRDDRRKIGGFHVGDYVTSECGVALLLDQHVNRPGHVPATLADAIEALAGDMDIQHPERWGDDEEGRLLTKYLELRSGTSMTDSAKRADRILAKATAGALSTRRNSYVA